MSFDRLGIARAGLLAALIVAGGGGCRDASSAGGPAPASAKNLPPGSPGAHGHRAGTHGGLIVPIDGAHYHVEAILAADGELRLLTLGASEDRVQEVESQTLVAYVRPRDEMHSRTIELGPAPREGDTPGATSAFAGRLPDGLAGRPLVVVVPSIRIGGQRLRFGLELGPDPAGGMPAKVADEEEDRLYLTPGGKYTEADIAANGRRTASARFAGFRAAHDPHPTPGDRVCPITDTRANPACSWVVGGETYFFCCPPCVDEFVKRAKEEPGTIRAPGDYVAPAGGMP